MTTKKQQFLQDLGRKEVAMDLWTNVGCPEPFQVHSHPWTPMIVLRIVLGAIFLFPIRFVSGILLLALAALLSSIATMGYTNEMLRTAVLSKWRLRLLYPLRWIARLLLVVLGFWSVKEDGDIDASVDAPVVISNHISYADILYCVHRFCPSFVTKSGVLNVPFVGRVTVGLRCVITRVEGQSTGLTASQQVAERCKLASCDTSFPPIAIFPEGTTSNGKFLLKFRTGAFLTGSPVRPILIRYPFEYLDPCYLRGTLNHVFLMLCQWRNSMHVTILPVWNPSEEEKKDPKVYAEHVHAMMKEKLGIPGSPLSFYEKCLFYDRLRGTHTAENALKQDSKKTD